MLRDQQNKWRKQNKNSNQFEIFLLQDLHLDYLAHILLAQIRQNVSFGGLFGLHVEIGIVGNGCLEALIVLAQKEVVHNADESFVVVNYFALVVSR